MEIVLVFLGCLVIVAGNIFLSRPRECCICGKRTYLGNDVHLGHRIKRNKVVCSAECYGAYRRDK